MNLGIVLTILRKELTDTLRDKRTLLMMVGVPIVLYPAMFIFAMQAAIVQQTRLEEMTSLVAVDAEPPGLIETWLTEIELVQLVESHTPVRDLDERLLHAIVRVEENPEQALAVGQPLGIQIIYDSTEYESREAAQRLERGLEQVLRQLQEERLEHLGVGRAYIEPIAFRRQDIATAERTTGSILGLIVPVLMVLMMAMGAFYPAVDITAGEKERGTFETLLSTPTSKLEIVTGKFFAVFLLALVSGLLNLLSMGLTFLFMVSQFVAATGEPALEEQFALPLRAFLLILIVLIPLGFLISAVMMSVAVFARNFKEAQNYVTPFLLLMLMPAVLAGIPGVQLTAFNQFVPIFNVVLLFRELMTARVGLDAVLVVFISTAAYAVLALQFAAWLFQREEVVLSEERGIPLTVRRSEFRPRATLTPGGALGLYALMLIAIFYLGSLLQGWNLIVGLVLTLWGVMLLPTVLLLWYMRIDLRTALMLAPIKPLALLGAVLTGAGATLLLIQLGAYQHRFLPVPQEFQAAFEELFAVGATPAGLILLLLVVAVTPAICEEFFMRGAVLTGLRGHMPRWAVVFLVGLLFGVLHVSVFRILPTALFGMVLTWLVLRTGSIQAGIAVHFLNNAFAILLATGNVPQFVKRALDVEQIEIYGLPAAVLILAVALVVIGVTVVLKATPRPKD